MDFPVPVAAGKFTVSSIGMAVVEIGGVAVGILFLSRLEVEICLRGIFTPSH